MRWAAAALLVVLATAGCILLVDNAPGGDQFSTTCALANSGTACGACITQSCAGELSQCCGDLVCRNQLSSVDECAEAGGCVFDMSSASAAALGQCIDTSCKASCYALDTSKYDAAVACGMSGQSCFCSPGSTNTTRCDRTTVPNAICCAEKGWPGSGTCSCTTLSCTSSGNDCDCSATSQPGNVDHCNESEDGTCCLDPTVGLCTCSPISGCDTFQTEVTDCLNTANVPCQTGMSAVDNCSLE